MKKRSPLLLAPSPQPLPRISLAFVLKNGDMKKTNNERHVYKGRSTRIWITSMHPEKGSGPDLFQWKDMVGVLVETPAQCPLEMCLFGTDCLASSMAAWSFRRTINLQSRRTTAALLFKAWLTAQWCSTSLDEVFPKKNIIIVISASLINDI